MKQITCEINGKEYTVRYRAKKMDKGTEFTGTIDMSKPVSFTYIDFEEGSKADFVSGDKQHGLYHALVNIIGKYEK